MSLKPLGDRVIVKADEAETTTASGLYLASDAKEKPQTGVVVSVGEGKLDKDGNLVRCSRQRGRSRYLRQVRWNRGSTTRARTF